jgi:uncharacterized protein YndB with AHSA1/START domain
MTNTEELQREFTFTWTLDSSPEDVFRAWTDPDHLQWFYNDSAPIPSDPIELDLRVGGTWRQLMVIDRDTAYVTGGVYREIVPGKKLTFAWGATGGWPELDPDRLDDSPLVTVTFAQAGGRTEMTLRCKLPAGIPDERVREWLEVGLRDGWRRTVDRLVAELSVAPAR